MPRCLDNIDISAIAHASPLSFSFFLLLHSPPFIFFDRPFLSDFFAFIVSLIFRPLAFFLFSFFELSLTLYFHHFRYVAFIGHIIYFR